MSQIRYPISLLTLALALGLGACAQPVVSAPGFEMDLRQCKREALFDCGGSWGCEDGKRARCMAEHGWKRIDNQWKKGLDARAADEIDGEIERRKKRNAPQG